jgi:hypothetical protein
MAGAEPIELVGRPDAGGAAVRDAVDASGSRQAGDDGEVVAALEDDGASGRVRTAFDDPSSPHAAPAIATTRRAVVTPQPRTAPG